MSSVQLALFITFKDTQAPPTKRRRLKSNFSPSEAPEDISQTKKPVTRTGKVRGAKLPLEYDLVRFVADIKGPHSSWKASTPACEWKSVICDEDSRVENIDLSFMYLSGSLQWSYLPRTVLSFAASDNHLTGTVPFDLLPPELTDLCLLQNAFSGELDFTHLPDTLKEINLLGITLTDV